MKILLEFYCPVLVRTLQDTPANSREGLDEAGRVWMKGEGPGLCGKDLDQNGPARRRGVEQATLAVGVAGVAAAAKIGVLPTDAVEVGAAGSDRGRNNVVHYVRGARFQRARHAGNVPHLFFSQFQASPIVISDLRRKGMS